MMSCRRVPSQSPPRNHDPEELLSTLGCFQGQVQDLYSQTAQLVDKMRFRHDNITQSNLMLDELEARINEMVVTSGTLDQRWNDILDLSQVANILDDMECLFDELEEQLRRSKEGYESAEYWLCGPKFTTADISATTLVLRLYLLGLDERFFNEKRPLVCDYRRRLLERPGARKLRTMAGYVANQIGNITTNRCLVKAVTCAGALAACIGVGILLYKKL